MTRYRKTILPSFLFGAVACAAEITNVDFELPGDWVHGQAGLYREDNKDYPPNYEGKMIPATAGSPKSYQWEHGYEMEAGYTAPGVLPSRGYRARLKAIPAEEAITPRPTRANPDPAHAPFPKGRVEYIWAQPSDGIDVNHPSTTHFMQFSFKWPVSSPQPWTTWFSSFENWFVLSQVWQRGPLSPPLSVVAKPGNSPDRVRIAVHSIADENLRPGQNRRFEVCSFEIAKGEWHTLQLRANFSHNGDSARGRLQVHHRTPEGWKLEADTDTLDNFDMGFIPLYDATRPGNNLPPNAGTTDDRKLIWKTGIYRGPACQMFDHTVYFDNIRYWRGDSKAKENPGD